MNWFWSAFHSSYTITAKTGVHNDIVETADQRLFTQTVFTDLPKLSHTLCSLMTILCKTDFSKRFFNLITL